MNWLDLVFVVFIAIFIIIGIKRGFMKSVITNIPFILILFIAFFLSKPFSFLLEKCFGLKTAIYNSYNAEFIKNSPNFSKNLLEIPKSELNAFISSTLNKGNISAIPKLMFNWFFNTKSLYSKLHSSNLSKQTLSNILSNTYSNFYITIISFIISILFIYLFIFLIKKLIDKLRKNGFIKTVDNILGFIYGLGKALLLLIVICSVIKLLSPISFMKPVTNYISNSFFGKIIYNQVNNLFDNYLNYNDLIKTIFKT